MTDDTGRLALTDVPIRFREFNPDKDRALVLSTFIHSWVRGCGVLDFLDHDVTYTLVAPLAQRLLSEGDVLIACAEEDGDLIVGWLMKSRAKKRVLHYCWVRTEYRRAGVLRAMLSHAGLSSGTVNHTHETLVWRRHVGPRLAKETRFKFSPELLALDEAEERRKNNEDK